MASAADAASVEPGPMNRLRKSKVHWFNHAKPSPEERGWVPSPGDWSPPKETGGEGLGAPRRCRGEARPDALVGPGVVTDPVAGVRPFEEWLWDHGGYDVEGPEATAERERRAALDHAQEKVIRGSLDSRGHGPR